MAEPPPKFFQSKDLNSRIGDLRFGNLIFSVSKFQSIYRCRFSRTPKDIEAAQRLRFEVFNLELNEGLQDSYHSGRDEDPFDAVCDHILVEEINTGKIIGTYRLQPGTRAAANLGYYSEQEFDFSGLEPWRSEIIELGRACIHKKHRNLRVLGVLWRAIDTYAKQNKGRYLIGCSSLTSQSDKDAASAWKILSQKHLAPKEFRVHPLPHCQCNLNELPEHPVKIPKLLSAYMSIGSKIAGEPAIDREFKTIDFLTFLDLKLLPVSILRSLS